MVYVMTQTISEFTPYLNLQDKRLKKILVSGLLEITNMYFASSANKTEIRASKPYLEAAESGIYEMSKVLSPPNIFQKVFSSIRQGERPQDLSQIEIGATCSRMFE
jgi:hypothetical protein